MSGGSRGPGGRLHISAGAPGRVAGDAEVPPPPAMADPSLLGAETAAFEELLLQASKELQQAQTGRPDSTQIQPQPGFCVKTNSSEGKVFINICHSPSIPPPADLTEDELLQMLEEDQAGFRIPMSLGEPHAELDASQCS